MPQFSVVCKSEDGETVRDVRFSPSRDGLLVELRRAGFVPISVDELATGPSERAKEAGPSGPTLFGGVKLKELALGFRVLATMLGGGLPIIDCLLDVAEQSDNQRFRETLLAIAAEVRDGSSLSEAVMNYPNVFNPMTCAMIKAGEESGTLTQILERLASDMEAQLEIRRKIKSGTRYPMFIFGFFVVAVTFIFGFLLPKFKDIFDQFGAELPMITRVTMAISDKFAGGLVYIAPTLLAVGILTFVWVKKTASGKLAFDTSILRVPLVGSLVHQIVVSRLARSLSMLITSGVSIVDALRLTERTVGNVVVAASLGEVRRNIIQGSALSQEFESHPIFPGLLVRMTAAGEASGKLSDMLRRVADYYERESAASIDGLLSLLEPTLIVLLGIVVGFVVIAVYFPIFGLAKAIG